MVAATVGAPAVGRVALVAGATGLVGQAVLAGLLTDKDYTAVHAVGRRSLALNHPKLTTHRVDLASPTLALDFGPIDDVFITLGTTLRAAGSRQAFRAVDLQAVVTLARAARQAGAQKLGVVSAMGADPFSRVFYNQVKGEMEKALERLAFPVLVIARPSLLTGDRAALGQPGRLGERLGSAALRLLKPLIPRHYQAITANHVAQALRGRIKHTDRGTTLLLSGDMQADPKNS